MNIRPLRNDDICEAKVLWKKCFGDSDEFIDFFFKNKFERNTSLGMFDDGKLICDLMMLEKKVSIFGKNYKAGFLSGCATHPEYRFRGYMKELLKKKLEAMHLEGYSLCFLHPFLHDFYRKFGWTTVSHVNYKESAPVKGSGALPADFDKNDILELYNGYTAAVPVHFLRSIKEIDVRIDELTADGGRVLQRDTYYALYFVYDEYIDVIENTCMTEKDESDMTALLSYYGKKIKYFVPFRQGGGDISEYTMMRIVDISALRDICDNLDISIPYISDAFCPWNDGEENSNEAYLSEKVDISVFSAVLTGRLSQAGAVFFEQY